MTRLFRASWLLVAALLFAAPAWAVVNPCEFAPDGTSCSSSCAVAGRCLGGQCVGGTAVPDGTLCASGDPCSANDSCLAGVCVAGPVFTICPTSRCGEAPACQPDVGCVYTIVCPPPEGTDGGEPDAGDVDAGEPDAGDLDAGETDAGDVDAGEPDAGEIDAGDVDAGETDAGEVDAGVVDAGTPDGGVDFEETWSDVQGSGCSCGSGSFVGAAALVIAAGLRRRRRA